MYRALKICLLILLGFSNLTQSTKWLIDNPGFNDPSAWLDEYLPCARENVIFPETYQALLPLPDKVDVGGFILPKDGAILLQQETTITLGGDAHERECDKGKAYLKKPTIHKWFDPRTWRSSKEQQANTAIPDMERVPCNNESVVIKSAGPLMFDLEYTPYLRLGQLSFAGSLLSKDYLKELLYSDLGQFLFKNQAGVNVEYYHNDVCGCHKDFNTFTEPICHNVIDTCPRPHCLVPIVPYGSCCAICGSTLKFAVEYCENERLNKLKEIIVESLKEKSLEDSLDFYVNYINSYNYGNYLQVIIVDRDSYSEKSVKFMKYMNETTNWKKALKLEANHVYGFEFSGRPYNPNVTFGSMLLILLCLVFVSIVALVIFAHYKPDNPYLHYVPRWIYDPRLWRAFVNRSNNVFDRFDHTRASVQTMTTDSSKKHAFTMGYDPESGRVREQAFDNPMFGEVPSTSQAARKEESQEVKNEDVNKEKSQEVPQLIIESVDMIDSPERAEEEQELTEIKLESSSDEDEEQETEG
ncbi:protein amnionless [Calliphora vicina]|uniref:protein amnionless n=1 Tax=Calliphora vicina TaxID=7373 RepID=UPI00325B294E